MELLIEQNATREADLVPVRHGRMMVSPFTFYRGAAKVMATDLATTPTAGLVVQLCGDAHLSNFGGFASPERQLLFGLNDFDETLPGPFEYDLKRMAASFTIAARNNGFTPADARAVTVESVKAYRLGMAEFAAMRTLDIWYAHMDRTRHPRRHAGRQGSFGRGETAQRQGRKKKKKKQEQDIRRTRPPRSRKRTRPRTRRSARPTPATASARCPSSPKSSMAAIASSANHR